jgi:hypothetical protein
MILADFGTFLAYFGTLRLPQPFMCFHPGSHWLSHFALECTAKGIIVMEATLVGQLLGSERTMIANRLMKEADEMIDAQVVDIGIVSHAYSSEILTEIETVSANSFGKLEKAQVVLQVELCVYAMLL